MKPMELYIANVPFDDINQTKIRPALVVKIANDYVSVFKITSQYINKSKQIKNSYYPIKNWQKAGLNKISYVDTHRIYKLTKTAIFRKQPIGKLTEMDIIGLYEFIKHTH